MKKLTIRVEDDLGEQLAVVSEVEGRSINDITIDAMAQYVARASNDPTFRAQADELIERRMRALESLRGRGKDRDEDTG